MKRLIAILSLALLCVTAFAQVEETTKTGVALANEHKLVMEARRSSMNFDKIKV